MLGTTLNAFLSNELINDDDDCLKLYFLQNHFEIEILKFLRDFKRPYLPRMDETVLSGFIVGV